MRAFHVRNRRQERPRQQSRHRESQEWLGHADISTTRLYHLGGSQLEQQSCTGKPRPGHLCNGDLSTVEIGRPKRPVDRPEFLLAINRRKTGVHLVECSPDFCFLDIVKSQAFEEHRTVFSN